MQAGDIHQEYKNPREKEDDSDVHAWKEQHHHTHEVVQQVDHHHGGEDWRDLG